MEFLEHLAQAVERTGHAITRGESFFVVEPINLKIETEIGERIDGQHSVILNLSIRAAHEQACPEGILDCLAGVGENDQQAYAYAANLWTEGVFLTIHEIFVPTEQKIFKFRDLKCSRETRRPAKN